jgi:prephenate dehydrogenase
MVVVGVGLIGGSLALAARKHGLVEEVFGYGRAEKNLRLAQRRGMIDGYFMRARELPRGVDLMVVATPVEATAPLTASFLPRLEPGCLVSDVGSVKAKIVREMENLLPERIPFVGAHPIAGSEQWGAEAARVDLFSGQRCILTPTRKTRSGALKKMVSLWRRVGAQVEIMDPNVHDRVLGMVSHLPHVLAYAMVTTLKRTRVDSVDLERYCGSGFRDFTRIASSRPELWRDICLANQRALGRSLGAYIKRLSRLSEWIRDGNGRRLEREFAEANDVRRRLFEMTRG